MADLKNSLKHLRYSPLFSSCSSKDLERIAKAGDRVTFEKGEVMTKQGDPGKEAFIILSGKATVKRSGKKVATIGTGSVVGELSLLDHGPRTATVVCETECQVFVIGR